MTAAGGPRDQGETQTFLISVAAELAGMHAQTLRTYDRLGLVSPERSAGGGRRAPAPSPTVKYPSESVCRQPESWVF